MLGATYRSRTRRKEVKVRAIAVIQGKVDPAHPQVTGNAGAHHGVFPGESFAKAGIQKMVSPSRCQQGRYPLHACSGRGGNDTDPTNGPRHTGRSPVQGSQSLTVGADEDLITAGSEYHTGCWGAVGCRFQHCLRVHLRVVVFISTIHGVAQPKILT